MPGDTVAVIGCGGVGNAAIAGAAIAGARMVIAVDVVERKLEWAQTVWRDPHYRCELEQGPR